jgi:prolyl-tRNA editing enzyme YbaK/EbsC (Cys-tRNA(Pro) deacylase)
MTSEAAARRPLSAGPRRVQDALRERGFDLEVLEFDVAMRTSADAARVVGCTLGQIAKSLVFRAERTGRAVMVIASGAHRVDEARIGELLGEPIGRADPEFVREHTGQPIGGVAPLAHARPLELLIDEDLLELDELWAAAGHPNALFRLTPAELVRMTSGRVARVA